MVSTCAAASQRRRDRGLGRGLVAGGGVTLATLAPHWLPLAYLALVMSTLGYLAYNFVVSRLTVPVLGVLAAGAPGLGVIAASIIFATPVGPVAILGIVVILSGAALPALLALR